ncbi:MAG: hypothetical protein Q8K43_06220 [Sulfurimicrobium sp.]|nr:hypothetical protein [Sulfurimicrobium sp.]
MARPLFSDAFDIAPVKWPYSGHSMFDGRAPRSKPLSAAVPALSRSPMHGQS